MAPCYLNLKVLQKPGRENGRGNNGKGRGKGSYMGATPSDPWKGSGRVMVIGWRYGKCWWRMSELHKKNSHIQFSSCWIVARGVNTFILPQSVGLLNGLNGLQPSGRRYRHKKTGHREGKSFHLNFVLFTLKANTERTWFNNAPKAPCCTVTVVHRERSCSANRFPVMIPMMISPAKAHK
jgi:hypothetical protein